MNSTLLADFEQPVPIDSDARNYLLDVLYNAENLMGQKSIDPNQQYLFPNLGEIKLCLDPKLKPAIQFSPDGWSHLYDGAGCPILMSIYNSLQKYDYSIDVITKTNDVAKSIYLTLHGSENNQLHLNTEGVWTNSKECVPILQTVWNNMVAESNKKRILFEKDLAVPLGARI